MSRTVDYFGQMERDGFKCALHQKTETNSILTNCLEKTISLPPPKKKILDLTRGSEGIRKGQALKKQPRYTEKLGLNELCVLWWTNSKCNKLHVCYVQQSVSGYSW